MKRTQLFNLLALLFILALFMGCAKTLRVSVARPAKINMKDFDGIVVGKIAGQGGGTFSVELAKALKSSPFEVLSYEALALRSGDRSEGEVAVISGGIENNYVENLTESESEHKDKKTGEVKITKNYTRKGTATVRASLQIAEGGTGKILITRDFTEKRSDSKSSKNSYPKSIDKNDLFKSCRAEIIRSVSRVIAPYTEKVEVVFETDGKIPELERGFKKAKIGDWAAAIDLFQQATAAYANSDVVHKAHYNLGLGYLYTDQFELARTALKEAYARKAEKKYKKAIEQLHIRVVDKQRLKEPGRTEMAAAARAALVAFYEATGGARWKRSDNWLSEAPLGEWYGVYTDASGRVTGITLSSNQLSGPIPPELGQLNNLKTLNLSHNRLTGPIPPELGQLDQLQGLHLIDAQLSGSIPPELGQLNSLKRLNLFYNGLTGPIPPELGQLNNLKRLNLNQNELTGPIPPELGQLNNLQELYLYDNQLSGSIPPELGQLNNLKRLSLSQNELTGPIPPELGHLENR